MGADNDPSHDRSGCSYVTSYASDCVDWGLQGGLGLRERAPAGGQVYCIGVHVRAGLRGKVSCNFINALGQVARVREGVGGSDMLRLTDDSVVGPHIRAIHRPWS